MAMGLAVLLHLAMWWGWQSARPGPSAERADLPGASAFRWVEKTVPAQVRPSVTTSAPPTERKPRASLDMPGHGPVQDVRQDAPQDLQVPAQALAAARVVSYLPAEVLTESPHPDAGWLLDEDALASVRQARLTLRVWVSAEGRIDRVALLSAEPAGDWAERAVQRLPDTPMQPGWLAGQAVPSTLVVEIASEIERFR